MHRLSIVVALAVVVAVLASSVSQASPVTLLAEDGEQLREELDEMLLPVPEGRTGRLRRATCDLLSFQSKWVTPNHAACAAHCLVLGRGFKGGSCKNAVCVCRK